MSLVSSQSVSKHSIANPKWPNSTLLPERLFQRCALWCKQFRTVFRDVHVVFETHAEFAPNINSRLVAEGHVGLEFGRVAAYQIRPLVTIHADAMAKPVCETFVVRTEASVGNDFAGCSIHVAARDAGARRREPRRLRLAHDVKYFLHLVASLAQHERARDIGLITLNRATVIDHDDGAFANYLQGGRTVGEGGIFSDFHARFTGESQLSVGSGDQVFHLALRHAVFHCPVHRLVGSESYLICQLHERQLMRALDHAASGGDPSRTHDAYLRRGLGDSVSENEADRFFHPQFPGQETALFQPLCNALVGGLILLPNPQARICAVGLSTDLFSIAFFFERPTDL